MKIKELRTKDSLSKLLSSARAVINSSTSWCTCCAISAIALISLITSTSFTCWNGVKSNNRLQLNRNYHKNVKCLGKSGSTAIQQGNHFTLTKKHFDSHFLQLGLHKIVNLVQCPMQRSVSITETDMIELLSKMPQIVQHLWRQFTPRVGSCVHLDDRIEQLMDLL
jgi:hypothetical protein